MNFNVIDTSPLDLPLIDALPEKIISPERFAARLTLVHSVDIPVENLRFDDLSVVKE
jgi:hypothetical protein